MNYRVAGLVSVGIVGAIAWVMVAWASAVHANPASGGKQIAETVVRDYYHRVEDLVRKNWHPPEDDQPIRIKMRVSPEGKIVEQQILGRSKNALANDAGKPQDLRLHFPGVNQQLGLYIRGMKGAEAGGTPAVQYAGWAACAPPLIAP